MEIVGELADIDLRAVPDALDFDCGGYEDKNYNYWL